MPANANVYWTNVATNAEAVTTAETIIATVEKVTVAEYARNVVVLATFTLTPDGDATSVTVRTRYGLSIAGPTFGNEWVMPVSPGTPFTYFAPSMQNLPVGEHSIFVTVEFADATGNSALATPVVSVMVGN